MIDMRMLTPLEAALQQGCEIEAVALRHPDGAIHSIQAPGRHHHVIKLMLDREFSPNYVAECEQGFLYDGSKFASREMALEIAKNALQLKNGQHSHRWLLFSEDLW